MKIFSNKQNPATEHTGSHDHQQGEHDHVATKYQCPMKCEGDKVYDAPGNCPVCNMKLLPVSYA